MLRCLPFVLVIACHGDRRATDQAPIARTDSPSSENPAGASTSNPVGAQTAGTNATPDTLARGDGVAAQPPTRPPPGSADLVAVPADVARQVKLVEVARGFVRPVLVTFAPDDPRRRMFVVEQRGRIRILEGGKLLPRPFFSITGLSDGEEEGLLGLAFHPRFAENGRLYVDYTSEDKHTHIVEYRVSASDPDRVDPATARELIDIDHPYSNHNGGNLLFGPDGWLYTGTGDGGSANDPHRNGQNRDALLAKMLRFDVDSQHPKPERVHYGNRNPWRFWFDWKTGDLYIGDVGQNLWENVYVVSGADHSEHNFGWNITEGNHCFQARTCDRTGITPPVADYSHEQGCSVTGGVTYRGKALPILDGRYFYADYCSGLIRSFSWTRDPSSPTAPGWIRDHWDWKAALDRDGRIFQVSSFGVDAAGEVYLVLLTGTIWKLVPAA